MRKESQKENKNQIKPNLFQQGKGEVVDMKLPLSGAGQLIVAGIQESEFFESVDAGSQAHASRRPHSQESMSSMN